MTTTAKPRPATRTRPTPPPTPTADRAATRAASSAVVLLGPAGAVRLVVVAAMAALVVEVLSLGFDGNPRPLLLGVAVGAPTAIGLLARLGRGWPRRTLTAAATAVAVGGPAVLALVLAGSAATLLSGPELMLTAAPPFDAGGGELAFAVLAAGTVASASAGLTLLVRPALVAALPPLASLAASLTVVGVPAPSWVAPLAVVLVGTLLLARPQQAWTAAAAVGGSGRGRIDARRRDARARGTTRWGLGAATTVTGVVVIAVAGLSVPVMGERLPGTDADRPRFDARTLVTPAATEPLSDRPLASLFGLRRTHADAELFHVWAPAAAGDRLQVAVLPVFDGYGWAPGGKYRWASRTLPAGPGPGLAGGSETTGPTGRPGATVRVQVYNHHALPWIPHHALPWIPSPGRPAEVSARGLLVDGEETGNLFAPDKVEGVLAVTGTTAPDPGGTTALRTAVAEPATHPLPPEVRQAAADLGVADKLTESQPGLSAFARLAALAERFQRTGGFSVSDDPDPEESADPAGVPNGSGLLSVGALLERRYGTDEQFASAMALAALLDGYDARVVVGFQLPEGASGPQGATVEARHVRAWAEVRFAGIGWVQFDVTPDAESSPSPPPPKPGTLPAAVDAAVAEVTSQLGQPGRQGVPASPPVPSDEGTVDVRRVAAGVLAVAVLGAVLSSAGALVAKALRRRRRRRLAVPSRRVLAAWRETVDRMTEVGVPVRPTLTRSELSELAVGRHPVVDAAVLEAFRRLVDKAEFSGTPANDAEAADAWRMADATRGALVAGLRPARRMAAAVNPRPLVTHHRRRQEHLQPAAGGPHPSGMPPRRPGRARARSNPT